MGKAIYLQNGWLDLRFLIFLLCGFLVSSMPFFARDYDFTQVPDQQRRGDFRAWLRDRLDDEGDDVVISLNNNPSNAEQLSQALNVNFLDLQAASFGENGWNFAQALPIPEGISTVTFAQNNVYRITKEENIRGRLEVRNRQRGGENREDSSLGKTEGLPTLLGQVKRLQQ